MIYAENANYWKSGKSDPDSWVQKCKNEIAAVGGTIIREMMVVENTGAGYLLEFTIDNDHFKVLWPVLPCRKYDDKGIAARAAKIQASTFMYHDIKAKCMVVKILGARRAFMSDLVLPDGRIAHQAVDDELVSLIPSSFNLLVSKVGE